MVQGYGCAVSTYSIEVRGRLWARVQCPSEGFGPRAQVNRIASRAPARRGGWSKAQSVLKTARDRHLIFQKLTTRQQHPASKGNRQMLSVKYGKVIFFVDLIVKSGAVDSVQSCS